MCKLRIFSYINFCSIFSLNVTKTIIIIKICLSEIEKKNPHKHEAICSRDFGGVFKKSAAQALHGSLFRSIWPTWPLIFPFMIP